MSYPNDDLTDEDLVFSDWLRDAVGLLEADSSFMKAAGQSFRWGEPPEKFAARVLEGLAAINQRLKTEGR